MSLTATVTTGRAQYAAGRAVEIILGLRNELSRPALLRVFREWEYDILVRDSRRRIIWQWSDGKRMPTRPYDMQIDARGCRETRERWDGCDDSGRPVPAGTYFIEARLYPCRPVFTTVTICDPDDRRDRDRDRDWDRDRGRDSAERGFFAPTR
jgi:Intracellular proteinase inhibitor